MCGRAGEITDGRKRPRSFGQKVVATAARAAASTSGPPPTARPVGRRPLPSTHKLGNKDWWQEVILAVERASEVDLSTYMYDHPKLHQALMLRLRESSHGSVQVRMLIDREAMQGGTPYYQAARVRALHKVGAEVYLCRGDGPRGIHHKKAVIINRRVAFTGGANLTQKSTENGEFNFRMLGPIVHDMLEDLAAVRSKSIRLEDQ